MRSSYLFICFITPLLTVGPTAASGEVGEPMAEGTPAVLMVEKKRLTDEELACFSSNGGTYVLNADGSFSWCDGLPAEKRADF